MRRVVGIVVDAGGGQMRRARRRRGACGPASSPPAACTGRAQPSAERTQPSKPANVMPDSVVRRRRRLFILDLAQDMIEDRGCGARRCGASATEVSDSIDARIEVAEAHDRVDLRLHGDPRGGIDGWAFVGQGQDAHLQGCSSCACTTSVAESPPDRAPGSLRGRPPARGLRGTCATPSCAPSWRLARQPSEEPARRLAGRAARWCARHSSACATTGSWRSCPSSARSSPASTPRGGRRPVLHPRNAQVRGGALLLGGVTPRGLEALEQGPRRRGPRLGQRLLRRVLRTRRRTGPTRSPPACRRVRGRSRTRHAHLGRGLRRRRHRRGDARRASGRGDP